MPREISAKDRVLYAYNATDIQEQMVGMEMCQRWIDEDGTRTTYDYDLKKTVIAREMRELGLFIDLRVQAELSRLLLQREEAEKQRVRDIVGLPKFNPGSRKQVGDWLFDYKGMTPIYRSGSSTEAWEEGEDAAVSIPAALALEEQNLAAGNDEEVANFLNAFIMFKSANKLRTANVDNLPLETTDFDGLGRIHPTYNTHVTPSGRFSHSKPNIAQWASRGIYNMDAMLVPAPGHVFIGADLNAVEIRLYTVESGDKLMRDVLFRNPEGDPHALNYASMIAKSPAKIWALHDKLKADKDSSDKKVANDAKHLRNIAKRFAFLLIYGGRKNKLFQSMRGDRKKETGERAFPGLKERQTHKWYDRFIEFHPELREWQSRVADHLAEFGYVQERVGGRKRFFPNGGGGNDACNHMIQGAASRLHDDMLMQLVEEIAFGVWSPFTGICISRHDMIGAQIPIERVEEGLAIFKRVMNTMVDDMPITSDVKASRPWNPSRAFDAKSIVEGTMAEV